jgi:N-acetylglucosaminyl-diphospho-decaprenol L-rhamnosyltransferase
VESSTSRAAASIDSGGSESPAEAQTVDCVVVIVTYNSARHIEALLDSLPAATAGLLTRCIVVDNDSQDATMSIIRSRGDVVAIDAGGNLGYAGAINVVRGIMGPCSSILILNPDIVLEPLSVVRLYEALTPPDVGVAVPMILNEDGSLFPSLRCEPSILRALGDALFGSHLPWRPQWSSDTVRGHWTYERTLDVEWASGAVLLIAAPCDDAVGNWDDGRFFLYSEETDFAARVRRHRYRIRYVPTARVRHEGGGSGRSPALGALLAVNRIRYFEKYHRRPATTIFRVIVILHYLLRSSDPVERVALRAVSRRSGWDDLPRRVSGPPGSEANQ